MKFHYTIICMHRFDSNDNFVLGLFDSREAACDAMNEIAFDMYTEAAEDYDESVLSFEDWTEEYGTIAEYIDTDQYHLAVTAINTEYKTTGDK